MNVYIKQMLTTVSDRIVSNQIVPYFKGIVPEWDRSSGIVSNRLLRDRRTSTPDRWNLCPVLMKRDKLCQESHTWCLSDCKCVTVSSVTSSRNLELLLSISSSQNWTRTRTAVVSMSRFIVMFIVFTTFSDPCWLHAGSGDVFLPSWYYLDSSCCQM